MKIIIISIKCQVIFKVSDNNINYSDIMQLNLYACMCYVIFLACYYYVLLLISKRLLFFTFYA